MNRESFLVAFQGPHECTYDMRSRLAEWESAVVKRLLNFVDAVHKAGFDIYQTDNDDYRIGKKDLHDVTGDVLCVLYLTANGPILTRRSTNYARRPLNDADLDQFTDRNNAILMNRGAGAAQLFQMGRKPHWPNEYSLPPASTKANKK